MNLLTDAELCEVSQTQGPGLEFARAAAEREMMGRYWRKATYEARDFEIVLVDRDDRESAALRALLKAVRTFDPSVGILYFWDGYAKTVVRNKLTDLKRWSDRRLDATDGPILSIEADEADEDGGISASIADERVDVETKVAERRTIAAVRERVLERYMEATKGSPLSSTVASALTAFVRDRQRAGRLSAPEADDVLAALQEEAGQPMLFGWEPVDESLLRTVFAGCVEMQITLATALAIGMSVEEAAISVEIPPSLARRLLASLRRTLKGAEDSIASAA